MVPAHLLDRLTIKAALTVGFTLIFGLWLLAGYQFTQRIDAVQRDSAAINIRYIQAQERLSTVRTQILLGSVYVRDALLDPDRTSVTVYRRNLEDTYRSIDNALASYRPVLDTADEARRMDRLNREVSEFRNTMLDVISDDEARWPQARIVLQQQIVPRREAVIRLSEDLRSWNRDAFVQQQSSIAAVYRDTQSVVWRLLGVALLGSVGIGLLATYYAGRLEGRLRRQQSRDVETARDLQRLSAKLVTAQEEERRIIARELHDEVGQLLTALKVELVIAQRASTTGGRAHGLDEVRALADNAQQLVRDLSQLLHPALLDDLGLAAAVEWQLKGFARRYAVRTEFINDGLTGRLAPDIEATAYRIVQEALTNVSKHARASTCTVTLKKAGDTLLVVVEDDGRGFNETDAVTVGAAHGLGLIGLRERAAHLRGTLTIDSRPGRGTRIAAALPARPRSTDTVLEDKAQGERVTGALAAMREGEVMGG